MRVQRRLIIFSQQITVTMAKVLPTSYEKSVIEQLDAAAMGCEGERYVRGTNKRIYMYVNILLVSTS